MYFAQAIRYGILYAVNQLAKAMPMPAKAQMGAEVHLLCYLVGSTDFFIAYKQGDFRVASFSDANWGNNPDNCWSTSSYIVMLANAPISFKEGLQGLTAQSSMEAELVGAALAMKEEAVFCSNMMLELGLNKGFGSVPLYIDDTSATVPTFLAQSISHGGIVFSCKNWRRARSASSTSSRARVSWRTWAPSILANTVTATSSSSSTSLRLKTPKALHLPRGGYHRPVLRLLTHCSQFSAHFVVIYRGAHTLHFFFVVGSNH